ncbi:MAG TPA: 4-(cytidine 5'-diphospho)-2-C-methyl-D-erythritol kinase [Caulobacteraceae bacterium]|nr:4-(cytidine 5'-diphospho)-2-C-methyl-D-erythritol kinase [Caulobacteraceae bacterium]
MRLRRGPPPSPKDEPRVIASLAPAKVNLYLHVAPVQPDGYHPLASLMVFADIGDEVRAAPADELSLTIEGPFGAGLSAGEDNLVLRAARALLEAAGSRQGARIVLDKRLPIAAGVGGGSSDAGAALRLLRALLALDIDDAALQAVAERLGADGAACLWARAVTAEGRGEILSPPPGLPPLPAVLINPGVPSPTGPVYRAYDDMGGLGDCVRPVEPILTDVRATAQWIAGLRNDLEAPAVKLEPRIGRALDVVGLQPEALFTRMSGSGATCFSLCASDADARALAERLTRLHPEWWVRACRLGDAPV